MPFRLITRNLLRTFYAALCGAQNPHVLYVHSGFCAPDALPNMRSLQFHFVAHDIRKTYSALSAFLAGTFFAGANTITI